MANIDTVLFTWINRGAGHISVLDSVMKWLASDYLVPGSLCLILLSMWFAGINQAERQRYQVGVLIALGSMVIVSGTVMFVNSFYFRDRPFVNMDVLLLFYKPTDSSFPANSAAVSFALAAAIWAVNRRIGWAMFGAAALYGFARVFSGVHYPLDIIVGGGIGMGVAGVLHWSKKLFEPLLMAVIRVARVFCLA
ncbi:MAG: phosphatase PAP2 family protein [SAR202 cluster bacterium]|jgi:undecaprenyl-diphosphatase|nr:phosphatase PAP2 family protein [SAR202 cluster bacterium]